MDCNMVNSTIREIQSEFLTHAMQPGIELMTLLRYLTRMDLINCLKCPVCQRDKYILVNLCHLVVVNIKSCLPLTHI